MLYAFSEIQLSNFEWFAGTKDKTIATLNLNHATIYIFGKEIS